MFLQILLRIINANKYVGYLQEGSSLLHPYFARTSPVLHPYKYGSNMGEVRANKGKNIIARLCDLNLS